MRISTHRRADKKLEIWARLAVTWPHCPGQRELGFDAEEWVLVDVLPAGALRPDFAALSKARAPVWAGDGFGQAVKFS